MRRDGERIGVSLTTGALSAPTAPSAQAGGALLSDVTVDGPAVVAVL